jgi:hypothetical protein
MVCKKIVTETRKVWKETSSLGYFNALSWHFPAGPEGYHRNLSDSKDWNFTVVIGHHKTSVHYAYFVGNYIYSEHFLNTICEI